MFDLVDPKHPCEGQTNVVQDVGIRLVQGVRDLHLDENLAPARQVIGKGIQSGTQGIWSLYSNIKQDLAKRQADYAKRKEHETHTEKQPEKEMTDGTTAAEPVSTSLLSTQGTLHYESFC